MYIFVIDFLKLRIVLHPSQSSDENCLVPQTRGKHIVILYYFHTEAKDGLPLGVIIAIIIIVLIVLFIVVDVTCYYKRQCGVIMCLKGKLSGGSAAGAGSGMKDAEKGGDEYDFV